MKIDALAREAGFWDSQNNKPTICRRTVQRILKEDGHQDAAKQKK